LTDPPSNAPVRTETAPNCHQAIKPPPDARLFNLLPEGPSSA